MGEGVASIIIKLLCKLSFCSNFCNFELPATRLTKKTGGSLGLQQYTEQMKYPSTHSSRECVVYGVSEAAGTDFIQQQGEVKYVSIGT